MRPTIGQLFQRRLGIVLNEVDIILAHYLKRDRMFLYGHPEYRLTANQWGNVQQAVLRRKLGEPIAYITGHKEFFGLDFLVNPAVLIPRPDTELLVETVLELASKNATIADIGTGSGNIAISIKKSRPDCTVYATDLSAKALVVARRNARLHKTAIQFFRGDLLKALPQRLAGTTAAAAGKINIICCNAPYLNKTVARKKGLAFEPQVALTPPGKPTELMERLLQQAANYLTPAGQIVLEIGYNQAAQVKSLAQHYWPTAAVTVRQDLGDFDRVVIITPR